MANLVFFLQAFENFYKKDQKINVYSHVNIIRSSFIKELACSMYDLLHELKRSDSEILSIHSILSEIGSDLIIRASIEKNIKIDINRETLLSELEDLRKKYND